MTDSPKNSTEYYASLGRFVNMFAWSESMVFMFLSMLTVLSREECAALFSGAKVDGCCSLIKRLYEARGQKIPDEIADCLNRLTEINGFRNDIMHWGVDATGKTKNHIKTIPGREQEYFVSESHLIAATRDLFKISLIFANFFDPANRTEKDLKVIASPWQYKPAQRENTRPKTPSTARKP